MLWSNRVLSRFVLVGILNTILGLGVIFVARQFASDFIANLIGYVVVVPISFLTHRDFSFRDRGGRLGAFLRYIPTVAAGYAVNLLVLACLVSKVNAYFAQTCAIGAHVVVTYLLSHVFVFLAPEGIEE